MLEKEVVLSREEGQVMVSNFEEALTSDLISWRKLRDNCIIITYDK